MFSSHPMLSLRNLLLVDASTCVVMGIVLMAGAGVIEQVTRIPYGLLFYAGVILLPVAAFMALTALRSAAHPAATRIIVLGNALWVVGSVLLLIEPWIAPNALGLAFIGAQALVVAVFTALEGSALRTSPAARPAR